jgi:hypothetical protein
VVSIRKQYPGHAKRVMFGIWSFLRQFMYTKVVIVGGVGSRIAMRISAVLTDNCAELVTAGGFRCGEISMGGTVALLVQGAVLGGVIGGLLYVITKPWLRWTTRWHGLAFGLFLLITFGSLDFVSASGNFQRFETPLVNSALFALLPLLFGMAMHPLAGRIDRALASVPARGATSQWRWASYILIAGTSALTLAFTGILLLAFTAAVLGAMDASLREFALLGSFAYLVVLGSLLHTRAFHRALRTHRKAMMAGGIVLAAPMVFGGVLTARGIATSGEGDLKTNIAQLILDRLGAGGSYTEYYALDFDVGFVLMGHDGPGHVAIAQERPVLRSLKLYHGKRGAGLSVEFKVRYGPITIVGATQKADGRLKLVVAEGESIPGATFRIGNTNSRLHFSPPPAEFFEAWCAEGPTHHVALGVGHRTTEVEHVARLLGLECARVGD